MKNLFSKILILLGYGLVTFLVLLINLIIIESIFPKAFSEKNWTIGKEFLWLMWIIFSIGLGNAVYTSFFIDYFQFNFQFFLIFQLFTIVIGAIPTTMLIITKQKYLLRKNLIFANDFNKSIDKNKPEYTENLIIHFYADNEKDCIDFNLNDFFFIESSGNYIEIYYLNENKIIRKTFRSTLKRALEFFINTQEIIQCHRAFIVNSSKITNAKGNSQGLILHLENCEFEVPVSRNYVDIVRNQIR